ncbi:MAG: hypothetical protein WCJ53_01770, partial [Mycobacteriaceae bacterium]
MGAAALVGRVGGLAVALGAGATVLYAGGVASADTAGPGAGGSNTVAAASAAGPRSTAASHRSVSGSAIPKSSDRQRGAARRSAATATAGTLTVNPTVEIVDGIIQGRLNATGGRGSALTYTALGPAAGFDSTVGESGGKISLGTVPVSPPT